MCGVTYDTHSTNETVGEWKSSLGGAADVERGLRAASSSAEGFVACRLFAVAAEQINPCSE
jgi:hypothetical protein